MREANNKKNVLTGGIILITVGCLIILHKTQVWAFSQSWPLLIIAIAVGNIVQQRKSISAWIIGSVGLVFFLAENIQVEIWKIVNLLLPLLLILVGVNMIIKYFKKRSDNQDNT